MDYYEKNVKCPFWCKADARQNKIICEGPVDTARLQLWFYGSERSRRIHLAKFCCRKYQSCPVYVATMKKYEE